MPVPSPASAECQGRLKIQAQGQELSQQGGENPLHSQPHADADQSTHQAEQHRLEKIDAQNVGGPGADRLHDGQHFNPLLQMRAHGHGHTDRAQHHGYQADQAEQAGRTLQAVGQRRIALPEVGHLRIG